MEILRMVMNLVPTLYRWVEALIEAGKSAGQAVEIVKRDIESRIDTIKANRAGRDAEFERKHGEPFNQD